MMINLHKIFTSCSWWNFYSKYFNTKIAVD